METTATNYTVSPATAGWIDLLKILYNFNDACYNHIKKTQPSGISEEYKEKYIQLEFEDVLRHTGNIVKYIEDRLQDSILDNLGCKDSTEV